jgi:hypothetical protein
MLRHSTHMLAIRFSSHTPLRRATARSSIDWLRSNDALLPAAPLLTALLPSLAAALLHFTPLHPGRLRVGVDIVSSVVGETFFCDRSETGTAVSKARYHR